MSEDPIRYTIYGKATPEGRQVIDRAIERLNHARFSRDDVREGFTQALREFTDALSSGRCNPTVVLPREVADMVLALAQLGYETAYEREK